MGQPKKEEPLDKTIPVRMSSALLDAIKLAAQRLDMPETEVIRTAIRLGLALAKRRNYNLISDVVAADESERLKLLQLGLLQDSGTEYHTTPRNTETP